MCWLSSEIFCAVSDEQILRAYAEIARSEGVFCEPASAASVAGLRAAVEAKVVAAEASCVCVLTGNGLKDPDTAMKQATRVQEVPGSLADVTRALGW